MTKTFVRVTYPDRYRTYFWLGPGEPPKVGSWVMVHSNTKGLTIAEVEAVSETGGDPKAKPVLGKVTSEPGAAYPSILFDNCLAFAVYDPRVDAREAAKRR